MFSSFVHTSICNRQIALSSQTTYPLHTTDPVSGISVLTRLNHARLISGSTALAPAPLQLMLCSAVLNRAQLRCVFLTGGPDLVQT